MNERQQMLGQLLYLKSCICKLQDQIDGGGTVYTEGDDIDITSNVISNISTFNSVLHRGNTANIGFSITDSAGQLVSVSNLVNSGWVKAILIDQPTTSIGFRNGNSDNGYSTVQRIGNNIAELRISSKNATDGSSNPINGFITNYCYNTSGAAVLKQQIGKSTNANIGVLDAASSGSADPSTSDIPSGFCGVWRNTTTGVTSLWYNNAGSIEKVTKRSVSASLSSNATTTSTTLADVTGLGVSMEANRKYYIHGTLKVNCDNTGGMVMAITIPSGATMMVNFSFPKASTTVNIWTVTASGTAVGTAMNNQPADGGVEINGYITTSSTAGIAQLQLKSVTAGQTSTIYAGSTIHITEIQ